MIFAYRSAKSGQVQIIKTLLACEEGRDLLRQINSRADAPDEARCVNRYASAILMPRTIIMDEARKIDRTQWRNLYPLANRFGVTISALRVRAGTAQSFVRGSGNKYALSLTRTSAGTRPTILKKFTGDVELNFNNKSLCGSRSPPRVRIADAVRRERAR